MISGEHDVASLNNVERKKRIQKLKIIKHLYIKGAKSIADICERFKISAPTANSLINELILERYVEKQGRGHTIGGRKPDLYGLQHNSLFVLGIEMDLYKTKMAIYNNNNQNLAGTQTFHIPISRKLDTLKDIYRYASELITDAGINPKRLLGIGISMPGLVGAKEGKNYTYLCTPDNAPTLRDLLEAKFKKPVFIQNDIKATSLAEYRFGLARARRDVLVISMDWGISIGMIMDGKLRGGTSDFSGEFGHIPLIEDGLLCYCGKQGCLETVASGVALVRMAQEGIQSGQTSSLNNLSEQELEALEPQVIIKAANAGDQFAIHILSEIGLKLGKGIAMLIQIFNPELIILGGKMAEAKQYITIPIQQSINIYCMPQLREKTSIVVSNLDQNAGILGAVATVMESVFENYNEFTN